MDEWDKVLSTEPTENPGEKAQLMASKLFASELLLAREQEENDFFDVLLKKREFITDMLARSYQTLIDKGDVE